MFKNIKKNITPILTPRTPLGTLIFCLQIPGLISLPPELLQIRFQPRPRPPLGLRGRGSAAWVIVAQPDLPVRLTSPRPAGTRPPPLGVLEAQGRWRLCFFSLGNCVKRPHSSCHTCFTRAPVLSDTIWNNICHPLSGVIYLLACRETSAVP